VRFHQSTGSKVRPAAIILDSGDDDFVAAPITSRPQSSEFDMAVREWQAAGLGTSSYIRVHKLTVLPKTDVIRVIGALAGNDFGQLAALPRNTRARPGCDTG
jgi:mRNA interferase MazF